VPKRTFWLITGAAVGAGSSLWVERRVRRTVQEAAARLQPDALVAEVGRSAWQAAEVAGVRMRDAVSVGRDEMRLHEERLWEDLAARGIEPPGGAGSAVAAVEEPPPLASRRPRRRSIRRSPEPRRRTGAVRATTAGTAPPAAPPAKSPSHLDN
jgi:hypothetical protein